MLPLIEMPEEGTTLSLDKFVSMQPSSRPTDADEGKNIEIELAMNDLVSQILAYDLTS